MRSVLYCTCEGLVVASQGALYWYGKGCDPISTCKEMIDPIRGTALYL